MYVSDSNITQIQIWGIKTDKIISIWQFYFRYGIILRFALNTWKLLQNEYIFIAIKFKSDKRIPSV